MPEWTLFLAVGALGIGLFGLVLPWIVQARRPINAIDRVQHYTASVGTPPTMARRGRGSAYGLGADPSREPHEVGHAAREAAAGILRRHGGLEQRIATKLDAAGASFKTAEWLLLHAGVAAVATLLGLMLSGGNVAISLLGLAAGVTGPWIYLGVTKNRRRAGFNRALPDTLQLISGSLSAGLSLQQSIDVVVTDGMEPIASEFRRVLTEARLGVSLEDALEGVATRLESRDLSWVVMALRIQRQVGGNLAELLTTVAGTMREREYVRRQVSALSAEGRLSAVVLGLLPPLFLLYLTATNWSYVEPLFTDPRGLILLIGGTVWLLVGVVWMKKLVKVEV